MYMVGMYVFMYVCIFALLTLADSLGGMTTGACTIKLFMAVIYGFP
jgi:hypothetical protein